MAVVFDECYNFVKFLPLFSIYLEVFAREDAKKAVPPCPAHISAGWGGTVISMKKGAFPEKPAGFDSSGHIFK
jgi:hypothetical protein